MTPFFLIFTLLGLISLSLLFAFVQVQIKRKKTEENLLQETKQRIVLETKVEHLQSLEHELVKKENTIQELLLIQTGIKCQLAEKEALMQQMLHTEREKRDLLQQAEQRLCETFKTLSTDALNHNIHSFLELATARFDKLQDRVKGDLSLRQQAIDHLVKPIQMTLQNVDQKMHELEKSRLFAYASLNEQISSLAKTQSKLHSETANLVKALRTPHIRGRWGEIQLKRVVEMSGMLEHCDFSCQETSQGDERRLRPDMIVKLPGDKQVIVDSKTPLQAYLEALESQDESEKILKLKEHAKQVRNHIIQLSSKAYWDQFSFTPEFVVLFLPGEPFFSTALEQDPELIEVGIEKKVILATPTTLIALLKAVSYGWRQENIAENAQKISELGSLLHDRVRILVEHFEEMGKGLGKAVESYNKAVGSFESRVLGTARKLKEYGASSQEDLPILETLEIYPRKLVNK